MWPRVSSFFYTRGRKLKKDGSNGLSQKYLDVFFFCEKSTSEAHEKN
jgi:hypothetical protein